MNKSDLEEINREQEIRIKQLENIIKRHNFKSTKDILNENIDLKKQVAELEMELDVKDNLLKIKNGLRGERKGMYLIKIREIDGEQYMKYSDVEDLIRELEN